MRFDPFFDLGWPQMTLKFHPKFVIWLDFFTFWPFNSIAIGYNGSVLYREMACDYLILMWFFRTYLKGTSQNSVGTSHFQFFYFSNFFWRYKSKINWYKWFRHRVKNTKGNKRGVFLVLKIWVSKKKKRSSIFSRGWNFFWS